MSRGSRGGGFTEAEKLALAWSRRNREADPQYLRDRRVPEEPIRRDDERRRRQHSYYQRAQSPGNDRSRSRRRSAERDSPRYSPYRGPDAHRSRGSPTYSPYRGNESPEGERRRSPLLRGGVRRSWSRSRSRSPSVGRAADSAWRHDKFSHAQDR